MGEFFHVRTPDQIIELLRRFPRTGEEIVSLDAALGRVLAEEVRSPEDMPAGNRSTMDGFAVSAEDTFGASASIPALLELAGEVLMGELPGFAISRGQAAAIPTGGFLPDGADAVVMVEYTSRAGGNMVEVYRPATPGENVMKKGDDVKAGETLFAKGRRLRSCDIGLPAALGITQFKVHRRPRVAVISTGDEIVPVDWLPHPGQIRNSNLYSIASLITAAGGVPVHLDIVPDDERLLRDALEQGLAQADALAFTGGSSVGERDLIVKVLTGMPGAEMLAHGVAISPGKPTLLAQVGSKVVFGLPGHPVSAWMVASIFLTAFIKYLEGEELRKGPFGEKTNAILAASVHSVQGREEYVRVRLEQRADGLYAVPLFGKSGVLSTLAKADGLLVVPTHAEGLPAGERVEVIRL